MLDVVKPVAPAIPFDADRLDRLMDEAGIDVLLVTSKHNVQYLLGGHRAFFFDSMDAMGLSRYLPVLVYPKGAAGRRPPISAIAWKAFRRSTSRSGCRNRRPIRPARSTPWRRRSTTSGSSGVTARRIGAELAFLPVDAGTALRNALPGSETRRRAVRARAAARASRRPDGIEEAARRLGARDRIDAGGDRQVTAPARPSGN